MHHHSDCMLQASPVLIKALQIACGIYRTYFQLILRQFTATHVLPSFLERIACEIPVLANRAHRL